MSANKSTQPEGWFALPGDTYEGARGAVKAALLSVPELPEHWRNTFTTEIDQLPPEANWVKLSAFYTVNGGHRNLSYSLVASSKLLGS